jgi:hypothetical protein
MRQGMWLLLLILGLFISPTYSQATKEQAPTVEFELRVGNTKYDVAEGKTFSIVTPKGERVELLLRRKEVLQFAGARSILQLRLVDEGCRHEGVGRSHNIGGGNRFTHGHNPDSLRRGKPRRGTRRPPTESERRV